MDTLDLFHEQASASEHSCLPCCSSGDQYCPGIADCIAMWTASLFSSECFVLLSRHVLTPHQGQQTGIFSLHVGPTSSYWISEMPISVSTDDNRFHTRRYLCHPFLWNSLLTIIGINATVNLLLAVISAIEIWQFFFRELRQNLGVSFWSQFRNTSGSVRVRRALQTVVISGLLLLAGAASIVKAYVSYLTTEFVGRS